MEKHLSKVFIGTFAFLWFMGPFTQVIQIINLPLHVKLGLSESIIMEPDFGWFRADELAIAWADQTYLVSGALFVIGAANRKPWCVPLGFYTCAVWSFIMIIARIRWSLLEESGFGILDDNQRGLFFAYAYAYIIFGWYGMCYLWKTRSIYEHNKRE